MEARMVKGKACLSERSLIREVDGGASLLRTISTNRKITSYSLKDGNWYPLQSVLEVFSVCGKGYADMADVATRMLDLASPAQARLDEVMAVLTRDAAPRAQKKEAKAPPGRRPPSRRGT